MIIENQINLLKNRHQRYQYYGIQNEYQLHPNICYSKLNEKQIFIFKRCIHGLNAYTEEQQKNLSATQIKKVKKLWMKSQHVLNHWKQTISNRRVNNYLINIFGDNAKFITDIPEDEYMPEYVNKMSLKDLGITYEDVILKFMGLNILPKNFLQIS